MPALVFHFVVPQLAVMRRVQALRVIRVGYTESSRVLLCVHGSPAASSVWTGSIGFSDVTGRWLACSIGKANMLKFAKVRLNQQNALWPSLALLLTDMPRFGCQPWVRCIFSSTSTPAFSRCFQRSAGGMLPLSSQNGSIAVYIKGLRPREELARKSSC